MNNTADFDIWFNENRSSLVRFAQRFRISVEAAEDVVGDCYIKVRRQVESGKDINASYVYTAIRNFNIDNYRKEKRQPVRTHDKSVDELADSDGPQGNTIRVTETPYLAESIRSLPRLQQNDFLDRLRGLSYSEISQSSGRSEESIRQSLYNANQKLQVLNVATALHYGDFEALNGPRITERIAERVARHITGDPIAVQNLYEVFGYKHLNRAIQNATWILVALSPPRRTGSRPHADFLLQQLVSGDIYRGNKSYIAEASTRRKAPYLSSRMSRRMPS